MAVKRKISKVKAKTKLGNKLSKKGLRKKTKSPRKVARVQTAHTANKAEDAGDSDSGNDLLDMVDESDLTFLKQAVSDRSYTSVFSQVRCNTRNNRKRKAEDSNDEDALEKQYEKHQVFDTTDVRLKNLLPIKTKTGIVPKVIIDTDKDDDYDETEPNNIVAAEEDAADDDDDDPLASYELIADNELEEVSAVKLLANRQDALRERKIQIGTLSASLLENPEDRISNLRALLKLMDERTPHVYLTVRKLVAVSLLEVFRDLIPSYEIKHIDHGTVTLKKETKILNQYETELLQHYKSYLVRLEKLVKRLTTKWGDTRQRSQEEFELAELAVQCLCDLFKTHPYFNYAQNIAQVLIPLLNNRSQPIRDLVNECCKTVFREDKKGEITLKVMRIINSHLKSRAHNVHVAMLDVLLALPIRDVNLDKEKELEIEEKKLQAKKHRMLKLSKKERKHKKKLQELEKELLETKAEENKEAKQKHLTEITKLTFGIYFRILKSSNNTKVLGVCLEGLARFASCINLEFYSDLVNVLDKLLKEDWLGYREQLHCIQTVLVMLSGQGEALTLDPSRFYGRLYESLLTVHGGRSHKDMPVVLDTLTHALLKRCKKVTRQRMIGFAKRLSVLSLQLLHNGTLAILALLKAILQTSQSTNVLLDLDTAVGVGSYLAELADPEHCNAANTALYELHTLAKHFHPSVCRLARHLAHGASASGDTSLPSDLARLSSQQYFQLFDGTGVAFRPAVPLHKHTPTAAKRKRIQFADTQFQHYCYVTMANKTFCTNEHGLHFII